MRRSLPFAEQGFGSCKYGMLIANFVRRRRTRLRREIPIHELRQDLQDDQDMSIE